MGLVYARMYEKRVAKNAAPRKEGIARIEAAYYLKQKEINDSGEAEAARLVDTLRRHTEDLSKCKAWEDCIANAQALEEPSTAVAPTLPENSLTRKESTFSFRPSAGSD